MLEHYNVARAFPEDLLNDFGGEDKDERVVGVIDIGFADHDLLTFANVDAGHDSGVLHPVTLDHELQIQEEIVDTDSRFFAFGGDSNRLGSKDVGSQLSRIR